jgi:hypothetical protein
MKYLFAFLLLLIAVVSHAQFPSLKINKQFGGSSDETINSIINTRDNGFAATGTSKSTNFDFSQNNGLFDGFIVKYDSAFKKKWQISIGGTKDEVLYKIVEDKNGDFLLTGYTDSSSGVFSTKGKSDGWVLKVSSSGNIIWSKLYGGSDYDRLFSIKVTDQNEYLLIGKTSSVDFDIVPQNPPSGFADAWMMKLDSNGNILKSKCYGNNFDDAFLDLIFTKDNKYLFVGHSYSNNFGDEAYIVKTDTGLNTIFVQTFGGTNDDKISGVDQLEDSSFVFFGSTGSSNIIVNKNYGGADLLIFATDKNCTTLKWGKNYGGSDMEYYASMVKGVDKNYYVLATTYSIDNDAVLNHSFDGDFFLIKVDTLGNLIKKDCFGGDLTETANGITTSIKNEVIIVGSENSSVNGDVYFSNHGLGSDGWIIGFSYTPLSREDNLVKVQSSLIYPNPSNSIIYVTSITHQVPTKIKIYDLMGKEITFFTSINPELNELNIEKLETGTYIIELHFQNSIESKMFVKMEQ